MSEHKDPTRVAAGLKASIHNPHVSEEAKHSAHERLEKMGTSEPESEVHERHVLGGYKAALHNEHVSEEAKAHAREILEAADYERGPNTTEEEHQIRVLAGYKAAISNPRVSDAAKLHAEEYLKAHNAW
ncbi:hypothetical protein EVG20_g3118 [Dentipellis fragilis]|uniref:Conidiation protein 6 n=1 Tax=Dentipellis fragilis TaxID=205917 RepID=A0A4Y9Z6V4_9AGAM|nr:hypothetical protein EVG20_g3118 [Dentipellis fragilis]